MGDALGRGVVLVMSLWDDHDANMQWLDGVAPKGSTKEGSMRGSCDPNGGDPDQIENQYPNANVDFGNIRTGEIGSTYLDAVNDVSYTVNLKDVIDQVLI